MGFLGIVQPRSGDGESQELPTLDVTGTFAMTREAVEAMRHAGHDTGVDDLQRTKKGIVLNPQPSKHTRDPLNWPIWRRDLALVCVGWHCFVGGGQTSMLAAGFSKLSAELHVPISQVSFLVGPMMLALAIGSVVASPTAVLFGKRMVYLMGILIFLGGSIGCALSNSFASLLIFRMVSGFGLSTVESLPSATIAEIYFAHERAYRLGLYTLLLLGGKNLVPLLGSLVFENLTTHWLFWILTIIAGVNFVLHLLFVPETFWDRTPVPNERSLEETIIARETQAVVCNLSHRTPSLGESTSQSEDDHIGKDPPKQLYDQKNDDATEAPSRIRSHINSMTQSHLTTGLGIFHGRHTMDKWRMVLLRPFVLCSYPAVLLGALMYAFAVVFLIMVSQVIDHAYKDLYGFSSASVGLVYIAPFVGGCLGSLCAGKLSDLLVRSLAMRNHGIYEPEFRLFMAIPAVISTAAGLLGFGFSLKNQAHWIVPTIFFGVLGFGSSMCSTTGITYAVDSYKHFAQESLVTFNIFKNVLGFAFSFFNVNFSLQAGYDKAFLCYTVIELVLGVCAIVIYRWGKLCRSWTDRKALMQFSYHRGERESSV
ncbi:AGL069Cp [Eremothecium gossypii ATCC 10895]|uniref:AGL069Cp n=1 Tax=Eremothecium gossypii (strain ATCC 10895 / CBS 109.51 / FGSC 9923 / NRRL Y-1056) TaxID=284811 RepID=Q750M5_EREGS|nr:AGL069Cp [Eremothecium gossypii ATCC 10895]AAS54421.1 AGL069Cp [Eremothecium gossypii ATCC 10895]AEY98753.1 FAGL069Cp [Eremothecium gossypii FDAG1]